VSVPELRSGQMNIGHHAARAAAADSFEDGQRRFYKLRKFLNRIPLFGP